MLAKSSCVYTVQVSPPMDHLHLAVNNPSNEYPEPWWQRYQPVGYNLDSRSGSESEFFDMVDRCNAVDVRSAFHVNRSLIPDFICNDDDNNDCSNI